MPKQRVSRSFLIPELKLIKVVPDKEYRSIPHPRSSPLMVMNAVCSTIKGEESNP